MWREKEIFCVIRRKRKTKTIFPMSGAARSYFTFISLYSTFHFLCRNVLCMCGEWISSLSAGSKVLSLHFLLPRVFHFCYCSLLLAVVRVHMADSRMWEKVFFFFIESFPRSVDCCILNKPWIASSTVKDFVMAQCNKGKYDDVFILKWRTWPTRR